MSKREKPDECGSCRFQARKLTFYEPQPMSVCKEGKWLCALCESSWAGNAVDYPDLYPGYQTMQVVCYVGNVILAAIRAAPPAKGER